MNCEASITMLLNRGLLPHEERKLVAFDGDIWKCLNNAGVKSRCGFTTCQGSNVRILKLVVWDQRESVVMEIPSSEFLKISGQTLLDRLTTRLADFGPTS